MSKTARHKAILDLLDGGPVESQDSLQQRLERKGYDVGQATLSRDIHELKLVKGPEGYRRAGESLSAEGVLPSVMHLAHQFVVEIRQAQNLLVVKTTAGSAPPVAAAPRTVRLALAGGGRHARRRRHGAGRRYRQKESAGARPTYSRAVVRIF